MAVHGEGDFEFGPDAIRAGNQDGLPEFFGVERKQSAEPPDLAEHLTAMRRSEQLGQSGFDPVPQINVNPGGSVSFLSHAGGKLPVSPKGDKR